MVVRGVANVGSTPQCTICFMGKNPSVVVKHHGHDEHQNLLVFGLNGWQNQRRLTGIGQLHHHVVAVKVVKNLAQGTTFKAYVHGDTHIIAHHAFFGTGGKVDIFRR